MEIWDGKLMCWQGGHTSAHIPFYLRLSACSTSLT